MRRLAAGLVLLALPARADTPASALPDAGRAAVSGVEDGMTIALADGRTLRLAGIAAPLPPLGQPLDADWPPARAARAALGEATRGRTVILRGPADLDRYGRVVAEAETEDGIWLEGTLIAAGLARVATTPQHRELAAAMLALEATARTAGIGLWRVPSYAVRSPADLEKSSGRFEIVEGRLAAPDKRRTTLWMSFDGADAAIRIEKPALALFAKAGLDPEFLADHPVRIRGWVTWLGRPVIEVTHPEQIERLPGQIE